MATKRLIPVVTWVAASAAVLIIVLLRQPKTEQPPPAQTAEAVYLSQPEPLQPAGEGGASNAIASVTFDDPVLQEQDVKESPLVSTNQLQQLLPDWMDYEGVDLHREQITVAGRTVTRARGRFEWPNGSLMEMEVTDLGADPDETLLKSFGFNVDAITTEPEDGAPPLLDVPHCVVAREYDEETMEGSLQLLVQGRFLVEVQLENLPFESFQTVIDFQLPLQAMIDLASAPSP